MLQKQNHYTKNVEEVNEQGTEIFEENVPVGRTASAEALRKSIPELLKE
jgi:hypothetical protein